MDTLVFSGGDVTGPPGSAVSGGRRGCFSGGARVSRRSALEAYRGRCSRLRPGALHYQTCRAAVAAAMASAPWWAFFAWSTVTFRAHAIVAGVAVNLPAAAGTRQS